MARLGLLKGRMRVALVCGVTGSALLFGGLPTATAAEQPPTDSPAPALSTASGPSEDTAAISDAADNYDAEDPAAAAALADAAAAADAVPMVEAATGTATTVTEAGAVHVDTDGAITLTAADGPQIGIALNTTASNVEVVDGAVVASGVAPSTNLVTRASEDGVQVVAVLADENAPSEVAFPLDLPEGAQLVEQADGSISVVTDVVAEEATPEEMDRITAEVEAIIGNATSENDLTDAQWEQLAQIAPAETTTRVTAQQIATIEPAWAVDANGKPVPTHYEITDEGITQFIDTDANTAFPVTADPSFLWWLGTAATCVANLGTLVFGAAKLANAVIKIGNLVKKSAALSAAVSKLGGAANTLKAIYNAAKGFVQGNIGKYLTRTQYVILSGMSSAALALIGDALGIGSCVSLVREMM